MPKNSVAGILIIFCIFAVSLFWWPWAEVSHEVPKVYLFTYFVKILALIFAYKFFIQKGTWRVDPRIFSLLIVFVIWSLFTSFVGVDIVKSFNGNYYRNDSVFVMFHLVGLALLTSYFWQDSYKKYISIGFFLSSVTLSFITFVEIALHEFGIGSAATFGNPNFLAGYLVCALPFGYYIYRDSNEKLFLLGFVMISVAVLLIGAVSAIITLLILLVMMTMVYVKSKIKYLVLIMGLVAIFFVSYTWFKNYLSQGFVPEGRIRIFHNIGLSILKRPLTGYGWSNVDRAFEATVWPMKFDNDIYVDKAHSELLEVAATTGIPGVLMFLILVTLVFIKINKKSSVIEADWVNCILFVLTLYFIHSQTNVISIAEGMLFWIVVGYSLIL